MVLLSNKLYFFIDLQYDIKNPKKKLSDSGIEWCEKSPLMFVFFFQFLLSIKQLLKHQVWHIGKFSENTRAEFIYCFDVSEERTVPVIKVGKYTSFVWISYVSLRICFMSISEIQLNLLSTDFMFITRGFCTFQQTFFYWNFYRGKRIFS